MDIVRNWDGRIRGRWEISADNVAKKYYVGEMAVREIVRTQAPFWLKDGTGVGREFSFIDKARKTTQEYEVYGHFSFAGTIGAYNVFTAQVSIADKFPDVTGEKFYRKCVLVNGGLKILPSAPDSRFTPVVLDLPFAYLTDFTLEFVTDRTTEDLLYYNYYRRCIIRGVTLNSNFTYKIAYSLPSGRAFSRLNSDRRTSTIYFYDNFNPAYELDVSVPFLVGANITNTSVIPDGTYNVSQLISTGGATKVELASPIIAYKENTQDVTGGACVSYVM